MNILYIVKVRILSTQVALACPGWLHFGFFLAIEYSICAPPKKKKVKILVLIKWYTVPSIMLTNEPRMVLKF
jgi:hypothetical protein